MTDCHHFYSHKTCVCSYFTDVEDAVLPRKRKAPARYDDGAANYNHDDIEAHYRVKYYEVIDRAIEGIISRFQQKGLLLINSIEQLVCRASEEDYSFDFLSPAYDSDFNTCQLEGELEALVHHPVTFKCFADFANWLADRTELYPELIKLAKLVLILPASNSISERSVSALRRVKTFLRTSMSHQRLNHTLILHVHNTLTDKLDPVDIIKEFVAGHAYRSRSIAV